MGYTHYWSYDRPLDRVSLSRALLDASKLIKAAEKAGIGLRGGLGKGPPEMSEFRICLNGDASEREDYETFTFPLSSEEEDRAIQEHGHIWDCCKTGRRPYDVVVCAILLIAKRHLGEAIRLNSDGDRRPDEWLPAESLVRRVLGYRLRFHPEATQRPDTRGEENG